MAEGVKLPASRMSQIRLAAFLLGGVLVLLVGGYFLFVKLQTLPLYEGLSTADAAALVEELQGQGIAYSLADGGTTIRVAKQEADAIRLNLSSTLSPDRGLDGFELFNESDMGLTEFAQRIKYQRAIQGELARSILMIDGVLRTRVHIALPERSMFRGGQSRPTAAVTLSLLESPDAATITGIQHMVAASVPDLLIGDVVVLDQSGRLLSEPMGDPPAGTPPEFIADEPGTEGDVDGTALTGVDAGALPEGLVVADLPPVSLEAALRAALPDPTISILVSEPAISAEGAAAAGPHVLIVSDAALEEASRQAVQAAFESGAILPGSDGTPGRLEFLVRPGPEAEVPATDTDAEMAQVPPEAPAVLSALAQRYAPELAGAGGLLLIGLISLLILARRGRQQKEGPRAEFAVHLKAELDRQAGLAGG